MKHFLVLLVLAVMLVLYSLAYKGFKKVAAFRDTYTSPFTFNSMEVTAATAGNVVTIPHVTLTKPGFIAIYRDAGSAPGDYLFASDILPPGESSDVRVLWDQKTRVGEIYYAKLHLDNGNKHFDGEFVDFVATQQHEDVVRKFFVR